jgi:transposase
MQNLRKKMHNNPPDLLRDGPFILNGIVRPHLGKVVTDLPSKYGWEVLPHAPYSPDMSPTEFDLKEPKRGHRFLSLEEISAAVTRAIRRLNKSGTRNGIANLPKRWDAVIEKQGDYIEGL